MRRPDPIKDESVIELVRETANGLGDLAGLHLKMARRELVGELDALSGRAVVLGILVALLLVGYALAVAGVAMFIAHQTSLGRPFVALGSGHIVLAALGLAWVRRRRSRPRLLEVTANEAKESVTVLTHVRP